MRKCRVAGDDLVPLFSLGKLYLSDFIPQGEEPNRDKYELKLMLSKTSGLVQLEHAPPLDLMYGKYWYRSGISNTMRAELKEIADTCIDAIHPVDGDVFLDIASNDGTLLSFVPSNIIKIGIDPADESFQNEAKKYADDAIQDYFTADVYKSGRYGDKKAKIITIIAMFYDLEDSASFLGNINEIMDDDGLLVLQLSYTPLMLQQLAFDNLCHEHICYYSLSSLKYLLDRNGFKILDCQLNDTNGGSFRIYIMKDKGDETKFRTHPYRDVARFRVESILEYERKLKLNEETTYLDFYERVCKLKNDTVSFIEREKEKGKTVWGYGACYDSDTRVVTKAGIKGWQDLSLLDVVFTLNIANNQIEEKQIKDIMNFDYNGKLIHFFGKRNDLMVTPNHRILYEDWAGNLKFEVADVVKNKNRFKLPSGEWLGIDEPVICINNLFNQNKMSKRAYRIPNDIATEDFLYLMGLYIGDGYCYTRDGGYSVNFCIPSKDKARKPLETLLNKYNIKYRHYDTEIQVSSKALVTIFSSCGKDAHCKRIPDWVLMYSSQYLESLFIGLIDSDGWYEGGRKRYKTVSENLVSDFVELCIKLGYKPTVGKLDAKNTPFGDRVIVSGVSYVINVSTSDSECYQNELVDYSGKVWCLSVDNENFLVERNGKFAFCGNSTKGNTLLQWYGLNETHIDAIAERSTFKYGLQTVGSNIPIVSEDSMREVQPDYLLILPWHFVNEFRQREKDYLERGGKFIVPCPTFYIVSARGEERV